jgi:hypothetical protein
MPNFTKNIHTGLVLTWVAFLFIITVSVSILGFLFGISCSIISSLYSTLYSKLNKLNKTQINNITQSLLLSIQKKIQRILN